MFGWEFPPHISGGLGTACLGIAQGLAKNGVKVLFVMPKASGDEDGNVAKIINASDVVRTSCLTWIPKPLPANATSTSKKVNTVSAFRIITNFSFRANTVQI